ncbi:MAG TPA: FAD-dependent oxidoreductase [Actinomycetota bacterium]|nr:FAD-dependent oxidoreductase [Actinomycetota bacterium]
MAPVALPPNAGRSWWLRDALADDDAPPSPPLDRDTEADVVILGGGYTGMWTAWFLKELDPGVDVVILEQDICGGGPSGRNGGFLNSFWHGLATLTREFGDEEAVRLCEAGERSVVEIGAWCEEHGVDAWFRHDGELNVASSPVQVGEWASLIMAADRLGIADRFRVLDRDGVRRVIDSPVFEGGVLSTDGATVQPARLARGLRRVLLERGVRIHERTPARRFGAGSATVVDTPDGTVRAGAAVIGLNAWAAHWRRFRRTLTVRGSYIVLTAPAPEKLEAIGWTDGKGLSDFRAALHYVRTTPDGRIAFGVGGMQPNLARRIDPRFAYDERSIRIAIEDLHRMFPTFADVPIEAAWGGPIDVHGSHLPSFVTLDGGNVHVGHGYTGNGVGPAHLGGKILAHKALHRDDDVLRLPVVDLEPKRFPPEPIKSPGAAVANLAILAKDQAEDGGAEPNPFVDFVARLPRRLGYNLGP